jgi:hypothetical protein
VISKGSLQNYAYNQQLLLLKIITLCVCVCVCVCVCIVHVQVLNDNLLSCGCRELNTDQYWWQEPFPAQPPLCIPNIKGKKFKETLTGSFEA